MQLLQARKTRESEGKGGQLCFQMRSPLFKTREGKIPFPDFLHVEFLSVSSVPSRPVPPPDPSPPDPETGKVSHLVEKAARKPDGCCLPDAAQAGARPGDAHCLGEGLRRAPTGCRCLAPSERLSGSRADGCLARRNRSAARRRKRRRRKERLSPRSRDFNKGQAAGDRGLGGGEQGE